MEARRFYSLLLVVAFAAFAVGSHLTAASTDPQGDGPIQLRYRSTPGMVGKYKVVVNGKSSAFAGSKRSTTTMKTEVLTRQEVLDTSNGTIHMATNVESGTVTVNGVTRPLVSRKEPAVSKFLPNGKVIAAEGTKKKELDFSNLQLVFPKDPVAVGHTWKVRAEASPGIPVPIETEYRLTELVNFKGRECAKIVSAVRSGTKCSVEGLNLNVRADGMVVFAHKEGVVLLNQVESSSRTIIKRVVNGQQQALITRMNMKMRMELVD